jgi:hypothetical protein
LTELLALSFTNLDENSLSGEISVFCAVSRQNGENSPELLEDEHGTLVSILRPTSVAQDAGELELIQSLDLKHYINAHSHPLRLSSAQLCSPITQQQEGSSFVTAKYINFLLKGAKSIP